MQSNRELKKVIQAEVDKLPKDQQVILSLYYGDGLTFAEISEVLEVPEAHIRRLYVRAATKVFS